jgi:hypothetical protein
VLQAACPLAFDPAVHEYRLNWIRVPSVTGVLKGSGYIDLSGIPHAVLEAARARGTRVHAALHYLLEDDLDLSTVDEGDRGYLESAQQYLAKHVTRAIRAECRLWSERYQCAGTTDLIAVHDDGFASIDDFKTGEPSDVAADLQTAAYHGFALEMANHDYPLWLDLMGGNTPKIVRRRSIRLFKDGREARETLYHDHRDYARFLNALTVVHDLWKRPAPMPWDEER